MTIPSWAEIVKDNYRIEIITDSNYAFWHKTELARLNSICNDLNDLFDQHGDFKGFSAEVNYEEITYCKLCGHEYEPMYDHEIETCANCGGGKTEYAIKILKESPR